MSIKKKLWILGFAYAVIGLKMNLLCCLGSKEGDNVFDLEAFEFSTLYLCAAFVYIVLWNKLTRRQLAFTVLLLAVFDFLFAFCFPLIIYYVFTSLPQISFWGVIQETIESNSIVLILFCIEIIFRLVVIIYALSLSRYIYYKS